MHPKGVRIEGARITGVLDLEDAVVEKPLFIVRCVIEESHCAFCSITGLCARACSISRSSFRMSLLSSRRRSSLMLRKAAMVSWSRRARIPAASACAAHP